MRLAFISALILLSLSPGKTRAGEEIRVASDNWCPYICAGTDGIDGGYLVDLAAETLALAHITVRPVLMPLSRAVAATGTGALEGVYAPGADRRLRRSVPLAYSRACFYTRSGQRWRYQGPGSLLKVVIGVIEDYGYDNDAMDAYIDTHRHDAMRLQFAHGGEAGVTNLQKLLRERFDVLLEHEAVVNTMARKLGLQTQIRKAGCLARPLPLTLGFSSTDPRTGRWLQALADGQRHLRGSTQLAALQRRYGLPAMPAGESP